MKKKIALLIVLSMIIPLILGVSSAFADDTRVKVVLTSEDRIGMKKVLNSDAPEEGKLKAEDLKIEFQANIDSTAADPVLFKTTGDGDLEFNKYAFDGATNKSRREVLSRFVNALQDSQVSGQGQQAIIDRLSAASPEVSRVLLPLVMDSTSADVYGALKIIKPFLPIVRVIFGIGAIVIMIALVAFTILDLVVIGLPFARENLQSRADANGKAKIPFVSTDAISVIQEVESSLGSNGGYKNAYLLYFKRRTLTYIILSVCLLWLVVGELGGLIDWLLSLGGGLVN